MEDKMKKAVTGKMDKVIEVLTQEFSSMRTGRASTAMLDNIMVDYYGSNVHINQVAALSIPDPQSIIIQPWEQNMIKAIEKAIQTSGLDLNPSNDGKVIRIGIPPLNEERRKQLVKVAKKHAEDAKVHIRNIRRDANEDLKKMEKLDHHSEDDTKRGQKEVQTLTDKYIERIDEVLAHKEKEIMEV